MKTLLDHISFKALPGDLIALMGPSGAGKTTLLLTLNGYLPPSAGQVRINGEDLYAIYDALRGSIGYVPQDDIVHPELTVYEAVRYSARFRLPPDYSEDEIDRRVQTTLAQLGLEGVAHLQIGKPEKKILSGGQRKRVNIAMELVTDPVIMFLDEPTSGLAADDTTALVQLLADLAKQTGKTIITTIHQPAKDEFEKFNLALVLGQGGIPIFFGPTKDGYRFFGSFLERQGKPNDVDNPRDMFDMLNQRERPIYEAMRAQNPYVQRGAARQQAAREWNAEFFNQQNPIFQKMFSGRRSVGTGSQQQGVGFSRGKSSGQFGLLFSRYFRVKVRDVTGTAIMLAQAPIIGVLLALVFGGQKDAIPYWCLGALQELAKRSGGLGSSAGDMLQNMKTTNDHSGAIFFLVVSAVWFGTSNAAREIVSERAIYLRERMVNLKLFNYVFSKFLLLSLFCIIQCTVLLAIVFFSLGFNGGPQAFVIELGVLDRHRDELGRSGAVLEHHGRELGGGHGAHAHRAHSAGRPGRTDGADDDQPAAPVADVRDAGALGLRGRGRAGAHGDRQRRGVGHRPAQAGHHERRQLRASRAFPLRYRADSRQRLQRRMGLYPLRLDLVAARGAGRNDVRNARHHSRHPQAARSGLIPAQRHSGLSWTDEALRRRRPRHVPRAGSARRLRLDHGQRKQGGGADGWIRRRLVRRQRRRG